jgi:hypothetical protein
MSARTDNNRLLHCWFRWVGTALFVAGLLSILTAGGSSSRASIATSGPGQAASEGTINGTVRRLDLAGTNDGRIVEAVNLQTHERRRVITNRAGGFTFKVSPGTYRVELTLRRGESLVSQPGVMHVNTNNAGTQADFVVGNVRVSRPRGPAYRVDHGLRGPIA